MTRRTFMRTLAQGLITAGLFPAQVRAAQSDEKRLVQFVFAQLKYRGGDWNPHPLSVTPLMEELMLRTSVEAATARRRTTPAMRRAASKSRRVPARRRATARKASTVRISILRRAA